EHRADPSVPARRRGGAARRARGLPRALTRDARPTGPASARQLRHQLHRLGLLGGDRQPREAAVRPRAVTVADAIDRADQRHLVAELVGHRGHGLVLAFGEEQLLDALRGIVEAAPHHHVLVEVLVAVTHAADAERHAWFHARERAERAGAGIRKRDLSSLVRDGLLALEDLAHDRDVIADTPVWPAPRLAVPALDDLRTRDAEPGDDATAAGERVDRADRHRRGGR